MAVRDMLRVPNLLSLANAACGFTAILLLLGAIRLPPGASERALAASLIFLAFISDMLDGVIARRMGSSGPFGAILDSLADMISFGVAPAAMIAVTTAPDDISSPWPELALVLSFLYAAGVMLRLARYTHEAVIESSRSSSSSPRTFKGLPSPAAGMMIAAAVLLADGWSGLLGPDAALFGPWALFLLSSITPFLMIGTLRFPDLPKFYAARRLPTWHLFALPILIVAIGPGSTLTILGFAYLLLGPRIAREHD